MSDFSQPDSQLNPGLSDVVRFEKTSRGLRLFTAHSIAEVSVWREGLVQVRIRETMTQKSSFSLAVFALPAEVAFSIEENTTGPKPFISLKTNILELKIGTRPLIFDLFSLKGEPLSIEDSGLKVKRLKSGLRRQRILQKAERIMAPPENEGSFFIGILNRLIYGIFHDKAIKTTFDLGLPDNRFVSFSSEEDELDFYFFHGENIPQILESFTWLTGRMPIPPKWSLGYHQSRCSYFPDSEVLSKALTFREKEIPCDVIYLDIHHMDQFRPFSFDPVRFSDPEDLVAQLESLGFKVVIVINPTLKNEVSQSVFPEFSSLETLKSWADKFQFYTQPGIEGFNIDFDNGELLMVRATWEGVTQHLNGKRPFVLSKVRNVGIQRYAAVGSGEYNPTEVQMLAGLRQIHSLGLAGIAFTGQALGSFDDQPHSSIFPRWVSISAFSPLFRGHSGLNTRDAEPWAFGEEAEEIARNYIRLRYKLAPYLYSLFYEASQNGMPVSRSMAIHYPHNPQVFQPEFENQFFFGPSILVIPVESTKENTSVYLPEGEWFELFSDTCYGANQVINKDCPVEILPLFVKAGSIIPMQMPQSSLGIPPEPLLELHLYDGGEGETSFKLYEDDGETFQYADGDFALRLIRLDNKNKKLTVLAPVGNFESDFHRLRLVFHGYSYPIENLTAMEYPAEGQISLDTDVTSQKIFTQPQAWRFMEPYSKLDPKGVRGLREIEISAVQVAELSFPDNKLEIQWV